jgi:hypothetical protein
VVGAVFILTCDARAAQRFRLPMNLKHVQTYRVTRRGHRTAARTGLPGALRAPDERFAAAARALALQL